MKKTTMLCLMASVILFSCKKEIIEKDLSNMSDQELTKEFGQKTLGLVYLIQTDNLPQFRGESCETTYDYQKAQCTAKFLKDTGKSISLGGAGAFVSTPLGGLAIGVGLILDAANDYRMCNNTAIQSRDLCIKNQK